MGGWSEEDMRKPLITVAAPYTNASSCNHHFDQLAKHIADAVEAAGGKAYVCHPPVITDGMTMGAEVDAIRYVPFFQLVLKHTIVHCTATGDEVFAPQPRHGG